MSIDQHKFQEFTPFQTQYPKTPTRLAKIKSSTETKSRFKSYTDKQFGTLDAKMLKELQEAARKGNI